MPLVLTRSESIQLKGMLFPLAARGCPVSMCIVATPQTAFKQTLPVAHEDTGEKGGISNGIPQVGRAWKKMYIALQKCFDVKASQK